MEVILKEDDEKSLRNYIYTIAVEEFANAKRDSGIGRPYNQTEIAEFFSVSTTTIRVWEELGLPYGSMGDKTKYYDPFACKQWVLSQHR